MLVGCKDELALMKNSTTDPRLMVAAAMLVLLTTTLAAQQAAPPISASEETTPPPASIAQLRDPFWPVDYRPPKPQGTATTNTTVVTPDEVPRTEKANWRAAEAKIGKQLKANFVKGPNGKHFAFLNKKLVEAGSTISLQIRPYSYHWTIVSFDDVEGIRLKRKGTRYTGP